MSPIIEALAEQHDACIIVDREGDIALLQREYDNEGIECVRMRPDPCCFHQASRWESMSASEAAATVC